MLMGVNFTKGDAVAFVSLLYGCSPLQQSDHRLLFGLNF